MIATLLLAAGQSSRMGARDKLLETVDGVPLLALLTARALSVGPTFVTLPSADHPRRFALPQSAQIVVVDANLGMAHSIKAGIAALGDTATGVMILPADMPDITASDMAAVQVAAAESGLPIVRASTQDGRAGHPIYFAASQFPRFADLDGDRGAHRLTLGLEDQTRLIALKGDRARLDLDTPEDWEAYRART
jgi:CTP:molybdopterin cytidylyltransferase MocA